MSIIKKKNNQTELDLLSLAAAMLKKAWLVLLVSLLCSALLTGYFYYKVPEYKGSISMYVHNTKYPAELSNITTSDISASAMLLQTYANVMKSNAVLDRVIELSGVDISAEQLSLKIGIDAAENTSLMMISVKDSNPEVAALLANSIAETISSNYEAIVPGSAVRIIDYAKVPTKREGLSYPKIAVLGFGVGFLASVCLVIFLSLKKKRIKKEKQLKDFDYPILGTINTQMVPEEIGDLYEELKKNIIYSIPGKECKRIAITSASPNENKSLVTQVLSLALAKDGYRVIQIDCDLRNGDLTKLLQQKLSPGVSEVLTGAVNIEDVSFNISPHLYVVPCGEPSINPQNLLKSGELEESLKRIENDYDFILLDMPSADNSEEVAEICRSATGIVLNVRMKYAWKQAVEETLEMLNNNDFNVLGLTIMN